MRRAKEGSTTMVRKCDKCGILLSKDYIHQLCPQHYKEAYGCEPGDGR